MTQNPEPDWARRFWLDAPAYPDIKQSSITEPIQIGRGPGLHLRNSGAHLWGRQGSGKTVVLADIIAGALQCDDCLVWTVGDELARAFMRPYLTGVSRISPIDWVATTGEELFKMASAALKIATARRSGYTDLRHDANTHQTPVGDGSFAGAPPHILIVVDDEWLFRNCGRADTATLNTAFEQVTSMTGTGAVSVVYASMFRHNAPEFARRMPIRIGMRITNDGELAQAFPEAEVLAHPVTGTGHIRVDPDGYVNQFKAYLLYPQNMDAIGQDTADWRPVMDELSQDAAGYDYRSRWDRAPRGLKVIRPAD